MAEIARSSATTAAPTVAVVTRRFATSHNSAYANMPFTPQGGAQGTSHQPRPLSEIFKPLLYMTQYSQIWLSADKMSVARKILSILTHNKLIVGGTILTGPSHFWWKEKEIDLEYFYVMGFTLTKNRDAIEREYAKVNDEEVPMATFLPMDGNAKFLSYIEENVQAAT